MLQQRCWKVPGSNPGPRSRHKSRLAFKASSRKSTAASSVWNLPRQAFLSRKVPFEIRAKHAVVAFAQHRQNIGNHRQNIGKRPANSPLSYARPRGSPCNPLVLPCDWSTQQRLRREFTPKPRGIQLKSRYRVQKQKNAQWYETILVLGRFHGIQPGARLRAAAGGRAGGPGGLPKLRTA